jgi:hypothetical protein
MRRKSGSVSERSNESSETGLKFASFTTEIEILIPSSFKNMIVDPMLLLISLPSLGGHHGRTLNKMCGASQAKI